MKNLKLNVLFFAFLLSSGISVAQVSQQEAIMSHGSQNAYVQDHPDAKEKHIEKAWKEVIKEYKGKVKKNKKSDEYETLELSVPLISRSPLNLYLKVEEKKGMSSTMLFVDDGTQYISDNNDQDANMNIEKLLTSFAFEVEKLAVEDILDDEEKNAKKLSKDLEKLEKGNTKLHEDIEDYEKKIAQAELDIEQNLKDQEAQNIEINNQAKLIEEIKDRLNNIGKK